MSKNIEIARAVLEELKCKSYETLLSMPSPSLMVNQKLSQDVTLEFNRTVAEDKNLQVELKLRIWELPHQKEQREREQEKFFKDADIEITQEEEDDFADYMEELLAEGVVELM